MTIECPDGIPWKEWSLKRLEERLTLTAEKEYMGLSDQFVRVRKQYIDGLKELQANIRAPYSNEDIFYEKIEDELRDIEKVSQVGLALVQVFNAKKAFENVWMNPTEVYDKPERE